MAEFFRAKHQLNCIRCQDASQLSRAADFWKSRYLESGLSSPPERRRQQARQHVFVVYHEIVRTGHRTHTAQLLARRVCGTATLTAPTRGATIGCVTRLAIDSSRLMANLFGKVGIFAALTSSLHAFSIANELTHLEAIVHPRHARLYRRVFGAEPIGEPFNCVEVGAQAQRMRAQIEYPQDYHLRLRGHFVSGLKSRLSDGPTKHGTT